jgi:hypothetical protein
MELVGDLSSMSVEHEHELMQLLGHYRRTSEE